MTAEMTPKSEIRQDRCAKGDAASEAAMRHPTEAARRARIRQLRERAIEAGDQR